MSGLRLALVALLVASTALFAAGVIAERAQTDTQAGPARVETGETGETGEAVEAGETGGESETVLGVDVESTPLIVLAVVAGLGLAALVASPAGRRPAVLLTVAVIAFAWAALDVREAVHQVDESHAGIAATAMVVAGLHLTAAAIAGVAPRLLRLGQIHAQELARASETGHD